ncbi:hypothetical protein AU693_004721 [Salmonella enterica subsp. diarizonae]|nr:hypothetical protein [Salmonella enterica subsp. diarizonae]
MSDSTNKKTDAQRRIGIRSRKVTTGVSAPRPHSDDDLPEWIHGQRTVFWVWAYIRNATYDILGLITSPCRPHEKPYDELSASKYPANTGERRSIIKIWYQKINKEWGPNDTDKIMIQMRDEWFYIMNNIKTVDWLRINDVHTIWLWNHLKKEEIFADSIPFWFNPSNAHERFLAINATIDFFMPAQTTDVYDITKKKNKFTAKQKRNYKIRTMDSKKPVCQISVKISPHAKTLLDKMVRNAETTQSKMIESLIIDRVAEGSQSDDNS